MRFLRALANEDVNSRRLVDAQDFNDDIAITDADVVNIGLWFVSREN